MVNIAYFSFYFGKKNSQFFRYAGSGRVLHDPGCPNVLAVRVPENIPAQVNAKRDVVGWVVDTKDPVIQAFKDHVLKNLKILQTHHNRIMNIKNQCSQIE